MFSVNSKHVVWVLKKHNRRFPNPTFFQNLLSNKCPKNGSVRRRIFGHINALSLMFHGSLDNLMCMGMFTVFLVEVKIHIPTCGVDTGSLSKKVLFSW
jgi:hypothetical protein